MALTAPVELIQNHSYSPRQPLAWISNLPPKPREKRKWLAQAGHQAEDLLELDMGVLVSPTFPPPVGLFGSEGGF